MPTIDPSEHPTRPATGAPVMGLLRAAVGVAALIPAPFVVADLWILRSGSREVPR